MDAWQRKTQDKRALARDAEYLADGIAYIKRREEKRWIWRRAYGS
jgi:hypothetical protein